MSQHQAVATSKMITWWAPEVVSTGECMKRFWEVSCGKTENQLLSQGQASRAQFCINSSNSK